MPYLKCEKCEKEFYTKPSYLNKGWGRFCSNKCSFETRKRGRVVKCEVCSKEVYKTQTQLNWSKSKKHFCSKSCFAVWKNTHMFLGEKSARWINGIASYRKIMLRNKVSIRCSDCGIENIKVLVTHHIDGNRENNDVKNLTWLCRNCHYLIHKGKTL